jgi:hypothetical protein
VRCAPKTPADVLVSSRRREKCHEARTVRAGARHRDVGGGHVLFAAICPHVRISVGFHDINAIAAIYEVSNSVRAEFMGVG